MIRYTPPKSRLWGHSVNRLSATEILEKGNCFLRENTHVDVSRRSLELGWTGELDGLRVEALEAIPPEIGSPSEVLDLPARSFHKRSWNLDSPGLSKVVHWLDKYEGSFAPPASFISVDQVVGFRWLPTFRNDEPELSVPQIFGLNLTQPRSVTTLFIFYSLAHYHRIKSYLAEIGLASLSDKHVRPKGVVGGGSV